MKKKQVTTLAIVTSAITALGVGLVLTSSPKPTMAQTPNSVMEIASSEQSTQVQPRVEQPRIDVVFVLDTTGSMSGMLAGAKQKIWSLANEIASGQPRPIVRFGLVGYRDKGDEYVTKVTGLSEDMDAMYDSLMAFSAGGGGDGPEHVNQALSDSLYKMQWEKGEKVLRIVFLVGDAPPHDDYQDGLNSATLASNAKEMGIIVNTLRTGTNYQAGVAWENIARLAGGQYDSISQNGGMVAVSTPYDKKLMELNRLLADTTIAYGSEVQRRKVRTKVSNRHSMKAEVAASAVSYSAKKRSAGLGEGDLLEELAEGRLSMDSLEDGLFGGELRGMSKGEQKRFIAEKQQKRKEAQVALKEMSKERDAWVKKNAKKDAKSMDGRMMKAVREQASGTGVTW